MAKRKKTKLTAEFWRGDAEQRANVDRIIAILRRQLGQLKQQSAG
jgi:DNA-binding winged helix-turn-helix (wHTH) protein